MTVSKKIKISPVLSIWEPVLLLRMIFRNILQKLSFQILFYLVKLIQDSFTEKYFTGP